MQPNLIGAYGAWAAALAPDGPASFSWRNPRWSDLEAWRQAARQRLLERLAAPALGDLPTVKVERQFTYDGLHIEDLSWQLPAGPPTRAYLLKPAGAIGKLPAILALHDHSGQKYFGREKITRIADQMHPLMVHLQTAYGGRAWANEVAKRGYVVLVHDAFAFASRRILVQDVAPVIAKGVTDPAWEDVEGIEAYNRWASEHESILAKSLFCAGATWPGIFLAEDRVALDILCSRPDVDATRVGCGGLSGGGLRTVMLGGVDERIRCAVCVGMMTTWRDYLLNKAYTHTWMCYVPHLPHELDYPEILGLRAPNPTLVLNDIHDNLFTLPEMERADCILAELYAKAGAPDRYHGSFYPGGHKFDLQMQAEAFAWFDRWLKN
jgi:dienelactone hydrolase